jgi:hypothetical protein
MRNKWVKVKSQSLVNRLVGVSLFGFGASWRAPEPERVVVRDLITALEDKRALYSQAVWEEPSHVIQSIFAIRDELTNGLKRVGDSSPAKDAFRIMRSGCRDFLTLTSTQAFQNSRGMMRDGAVWKHEEFFIELGKLRAVIGQQLAMLCYLYGIDVEKTLATILPPQSDGIED